MNSTLADIGGQLELYLVEPAANQAALEVARSDLHRLLGVLKMVGLEGVAVICAELELTLGELSAKTQQASAIHREVFHRVQFGITHFLDTLSNGEDNAALRLFPIYQELQQLRGMEMAFELDLFYPNLNVALPQHVLSVPLQSGAMSNLKMHRSQYQQGLLKWMRQDDVAAAVQQMQQSLDGALRCAPQDGSRAFWWIAYGLLDCMKLDGLSPEINVRKLLSRIDQHMRAVLEGNVGDVKPVINEMLYLIGQSQVVSDPVEAIKQTYSLDQYLPELSAISPSEEGQILGALRVQLRAATANWELCVQGDNSACELFIRHAEQIALQSNKLDRDVLQNLTNLIQTLSLNAGSPEKAQPFAMDMAMALLLLGRGIEDYRRIDSRFQDQVNILSERMQAVVEQQPEDMGKMSELIELHYQMEQRGGMMGALANEMLENFQHVEQWLNAYFSNAITREAVPELLRLVSQIQGGLHITSLLHAEQLLVSIKDNVIHFTRREQAIKPAERYTLADAMSTLENYLQQLTHGVADEVAPLQVALTDLAKLNTKPELVATGSEMQANSIEPMPAALEPISETAGVVASAPPQVSAPTTPPLTPEVVEPINLSPFEQTPQPETEKSSPIYVQEDFPAKPGHTEEDQELLATFLEEAHEVLLTLHTEFEKCRLHPDSQEPLVSIRRSFHTLKGSGRMVGLTDLGEVAWCAERAMNKWLRDDQAVTPELLGFVKLAIQSFARWVDMLSKQGQAIIDADDLIAAAQLIENGLAPASLLTTSSAVDLPGFAAMQESSSAVSPLPVPVSPAEPVADGELTLYSPQLFNTAGPEVRQNMAVLHQQLDELRKAVPPAVPYDFMHAAHTLAGASRTMGFAAVVELASALESWLHARVEKEFTLDENQLQMLGQAIVALDGMIQNIDAQQMPSMNDDLVNQLLADRPDSDEAEYVEASLDSNREIEESFLMDAFDFLTQHDEPEHPEPDSPEWAQQSAEQDRVGGAVADSTGRIEKHWLPTEQLLATSTAAREAVEQVTLYDDVDEQLLPVFLDEADELCPKISEGLRTWREHPHDELQAPLLKRLLHTLKGSSRMVGVMRIGEIAHAMEGRVLAAAQLRDEAGYWDELGDDFDRILALIEKLHGGVPATEAKKIQTTRRASDQAAGVERREDRRTVEAGTERGVLVNMLRVRSDVVDRLVNEAGEISVARSRMETEMRVLKEGLKELTASVTRLRQQLREVDIQAESQMQARTTLAKDNAEQFDPLEFDRFTRLQELVRFMNESVHDVQTIQQSMLKNLQETTAVMLTQANVNRELQQSLMNVRMVSFNSITDRLYRIVRQTGKELNKRANLEFEGSNVELDRSLLEKMIAPFEHLLRNAMVHGLESDHQRSQSGKQLIGEIRLSVHQENNQVVFEFSDDGAGLDLPKLREKAISNGLLQADEEASDEQLSQLIFIPGLSTATEVTEIAGRGIGLDVVRSEIAALGGRVDVNTKQGEGTQFFIYLPLTSAVTHVLKVRSGDKIYAIPATMIEQVRQVKLAEMEKLNLSKLVNWKDNTYTLRYLPQLLGDVEYVQENKPRNPVLLLRSGVHRIALLVDELLGNHEALVKNIGPQLARLPGIAGATVLGDGSVMLILNPVQLAQRSDGGNKLKNSAITQPIQIKPLIMVVDDSLTVRKVTTRILIRAGYQVVTATDGVDALQKLKEVNVDVMLVDIEMPRMDGFALAREIRRDAKTHNLPIIMITSRSADKHRDHAMQLGVNAYLGKPYQEVELLQKISEFVASKQLDS